MKGRFVGGARCRLNLFATALLLFGSSAWAHRPFDGTDAAVADQGELELEIGVGRTRTGNVRSVAMPSMVVTYGLAASTEIGLEGQFNHASRPLSDGARDSLGDTELSMKHVFVDGSLQDGSGASVAAECAVLLPEIHGSSGTGGTCAALISNRWDAVTAHLNLELGRTREHAAARAADLIVEGPEKWALKPVAELVAESDHGGDQLRSVLVGAIYQHSEELAFDIGLRRARTNDGTFGEVRLGLTWSLGVAK